MLIIVARDGGHTLKVGDGFSIVALVNTDAITLRSDVFQSVIWQPSVSNPLFASRQAKWEGTR